MRGQSGEKPGAGRLAGEEVGLEDEVEDTVGEEAEVDGADGGDGQDEVDGEGEADYSGGGLRAGLAHVHYDDETNVVVGADDAVDGHQDGQPDEVRADSGLEDVELAEEASGDGQAEQREQEEGENGGGDGLALAEAGVIIEAEVLFTGAAELGDDGEGAEFHEGVANQIEEHGRVGRSRTGVCIAPQGGGGRERPHDVAGVPDGA